MPNPSLERAVRGSPWAPARVVLAGLLNQMIILCATRDLNERSALDYAS